MDEETKKKVSIALIITCLVLAAGIFVFTRPQNKNKGPVQILCTSCGNQFKLEREEFKKQLLATGLVSPMRTEPIPLECPQCGENTAFYATTCAKCGEIFVGDSVSGDFRDRCPECGYSAIEKKFDK